MIELVEILHRDLPLDTALRAAAERGHVLQTNGRLSLIAPRMLRGFARVIGGGARQKPQETA